MITLTKNWQNIASYRFAPGTGFVCTFYLDAKYSSQSTTNNNTTIQTRLNCTINQGSGGGNGYRFALSYASSKEGSSYWTFANETISTGSGTITHNADGTKSITLSASMRVNYTGLDNSMSATVNLPKINRLNKINTFTGNDLEGEFSATYTKYVSSYSSKLRISIPNIKALMTINNYESGTKVSLDEDSLNYIKDYMNTNSTSTINLGAVIETYNGSTKLGDSNELKNICSFTNANPTFTYEVQETNQKAISVLGTSKALWFIENVSQPKITVHPVAYKGATVSNVIITNGTTTITVAKEPYEAILNAPSGTLAILVTDSRKLSTSEVTETPLIPYTPVSINSFEFKRENPTSSNIILNAEFTYTQQTFNTTENVPTIKWRLNEGQATTFPGENLYPGENTYTETGYITIPSENYTIDTEKKKIIIHNLKLENILPYNEKGQFYLYIDDLLTSATDNMTVIRGIPVMDWGKNDVQINGDLYIADRNRENAKNIKELFSTRINVLFEGSQNSGDILLDENIENYDLLLCELQGGSYTKSSFIIPTKSIEYYKSGDSNSYRWGGTVMQSSSVYATLSFYFTNGTTIKGINTNKAAWNNCYLRKIYGIKFYNEMINELNG